MSRQSYLTTVQFALLNSACAPIYRALGPTYLVGSVTRRADFRDVDLRVILPDEEFDALFDHGEALWSLMCLTIGHHLQTTTGLPVDFQIQRMTQANEKYPFPEHVRHGLGFAVRQYAGGGDATWFGDRA